MTATNHDDQLGEIYPMMLNELNCTFGVSFSQFHCCGRHCGCHGLWPSRSRPRSDTNDNEIDDDDTDVMIMMMAA